MVASKRQKSPRNRHFLRFRDLRARDSWITLARSTLALGRQEDVGEQKSKGPLNYGYSSNSNQTDRSNRSTVQGRGRTRREDGHDQEGRDRLPRRLRRPGREAPQEGQQGPHHGPRHPSSPPSSGAHGPQPGDRRGDQDQGVEEGRFPRRQGSQGSHLSRFQRKNSGGCRLIEPSPP